MRDLRVATETAVGRREENQDSVLAQRLPEGGILLAVADGMGGHVAGDVASALALEAVREAVEAGEELREALLLANGRVYEKGQDPGYHGMGTTLTVVLLRGEEFHVANVGDSRCYLLDEEGIRQLTEDHSFLAEAVRRGQPKELAMASQWKDALIRSVGSSDEVEVDLFGPFPARENTTLLLCSDGLYKTLGDPELREILQGSPDVETAAKALVEAAYAGGSNDNITAAVASFGEWLSSDPEEREKEDPEPVQEEDPEPAQEDDPEPAQEEDPEPAQEEDPEPVQQEDPGPVQEEDPEPAQQEDPEPTQEEDPEPAQEEDPEPAQEDDPEPTQEAVVEDHDEGEGEVPVLPETQLDTPASGARPLQVGPREVGFRSKPVIVGGRPPKRGIPLSAVLKVLVVVMIGVALYLLFG